MAKINVLNLNGEKTRDIATDIFLGNIRKDIVQRIVEIEKLEEKQLYAPSEWAGMQTSAHGNVKHNRHVWKTDRGKGLSRYPKKRMSDKGERFVWVAAVIPGVRGGRRAHPPKLIRAVSKINKKERRFGFLSGLAMISSLEEIKKKYSTLAEKEIKNMKIALPLVIDSKILTLKTKEFFAFLEKVLGKDLFDLALQEKTIRAGRGKMRNRRYKKNAGMIFVIGNKESKKIPGIEVEHVKDLKLSDIADNGARITMFTEEAVKDLDNKLNGNSKESKK